MGLAAVPFALQDSPQASGGRFVRSGADRDNEKHSLGFSVLAFKVTSEDTSGGLFLLEHSNLGKGGPYRHVHPQQDEWLYAIEGEFRVEVGDQKITLGPGDSVVMPRKIPHVWAQVGEKPGKLLVGFTPAGKMEAFFRDFGKTGKLPTDASVLSAYGLERVGPPLTL
jgi:mannose-6-phosphate isomerase-like protein (cupin superfamily)